jgi:hypothetical protein
MPLSIEDIKRLEKNGYAQNYFCDFDENGYTKLKNLDSHCTFYDTENRRCKIYRLRPSGCRIYPVIYDDLKGIVLDDICQPIKKPNAKEIAQKGWKVLKLLDKIDAQAKKRRNSK